MTINVTASQVSSPGTMDLRVTMSDADAKQVMTRTPSVTLTVHGVIYPVYEVNPTVVPTVYAVRLNKLTINSISMGDTLTFEV